MELANCNLGLLAGEELVRRADQDSEHQGEQEAEKPYDRADHVTRARRQLALGQMPLEIKSHQPHGEGEETNRRGNNDALHALSPRRPAFQPNP